MSIHHTKPDHTKPAHNEPADNEPVDNKAALAQPAEGASYAAPSEPAHETVRLRPATATDAAALALIGAATFLEAYTWMLPVADILAFTASAHSAEAYAHYLAQPSTGITLAVTGQDVPVGYAMLVTPELPEFDVRHGDTELKRIYLLSKFRKPATEVEGHPGLRASQALLASAIADARRMGSTRLLLGTNDNNQRAMAFYQREGFTIVGKRTFTVGAQVCSDFIFAKEL
jgi:ribosomal protein S18 acetylase RimI-like enzyme